jgi:hypothetical protein
MLLYAGHWGDMIGAAFGTADEEAASEHTSHGAHCHGGQASCAEQSTPANVRILQVAIEVPEPDLPSSAVESRPVTMAEYVIAPPTEPPRI